MPLEDAVNEVLLTQVKIRDNSNNDMQLQLRFKGLSDCYIPYHHIYSSVPLSTREVEMVKGFISMPESPFYPYRETVNVNTNYFNILQIKAPRSVSEEFQKLRIRTKGADKELVYTKEKRKGRKIFRAGYFDRQARWNIEDEQNYLQPGVIVRTDEKLVEALKKKRELDELNYELKRKTTDWASVGRARKRIENNKQVEENDELLRKIIAKEKEFDYGTLVYNKKKKVYELFLKERPLLEFKRQLTLDEWLSLRMMFFDIETPKFLRNDFEITHVAAILTEDGKAKEKTVFCKEKAEIESVNGYKVFSGYRTDSEMIDKISEYAVENNVDVLVAYNINFDARMMRQRGNFILGEGKDQPKIDVSKKFFERFRLEGGFCIDLLRLGQTLLRGFPNAKLELVSRFLKGSRGYKKEISYEELEELQLMAEGKEITTQSTIRKMETHFAMPWEEIKEKRELASQMIISYVSEDAEQMPDILFDETLVRKCLEDLVWMADNFRLDFTKLLYSPLSLREVFDRGYFKHMGIQRDEIYPRGIKYFQNEIEKNKRALKKFIEKTMGVENKKGTFHNVERRILPVGYLLRKYLAKKTHTVSAFMDYVEKRSEKCSSHEFIFLSHYVNGIADYMLNDFGLYLRTEEKYEELMEKLNDRRIDYRKTVEVIHRNFEKLERAESLTLVAQRILDRIVEKMVLESKKNEISPRKVSAHDIEKLKELPHFKELVEGADEMLTAVSTINQLSFEELYKIFWTAFNLKNVVIKVSGNHLIHPREIKATFEREIGEIKQNLNEIIAVNVPYIYTPGNAVDFELPVIERVQGNRIYGCPVQTIIKDLYVSDKQHSFEDGFHKGTKIKQGPSYSTNAFYSEFYLSALESFWRQDYEQGIRAIIKGRRELKRMIASGEINKERLLFFNKTKKTFFGFQNGEKHTFRVQGEDDGIPVHPIEQFNPDLLMYLEDYSRRARSLIKDLLPKVKLSPNELREAEEIMKKVKKIVSDKKQLELGI